MSLKRRRIHILAGALCVIAAVAIITVLTGEDIDDSSARLLGSAFVVAIFVVLAIPGENLLRSGEAWMWFGGACLLFCAVGALTSVWAIWDIEFVGDDNPDEEGYGWAKAGFVCFLLSVATAHGSMLVRGIARRDTLGTVARYATLALVLTLAIVLSDAVMNEDEPAIGPEALAVLVILYVLGMVVSPLLRAGEGPQEAPDY
jgi:hypothetical protein